MTKGMALFGHGTPSARLADWCLVSGLGVPGDDILSTADPLPSDADSIASTLEQPWRHKHHPVIVVIAIAPIAPEVPLTLRDVRAIVQPAPPGHKFDDTSRAFRNLIPSRFLAGYYDQRTRAFTPNPVFEPTFDPALRATSTDISYVTARAGSAYSSPQQGPPPPIPSAPDREL